MTKSAYPQLDSLDIWIVESLIQLCVNFQADRNGSAVALFLFVEPIDIFRNKALHDSTFWLQDLQDF